MATLLITTTNGVLNAKVVRAFELQDPKGAKLILTDDDYDEHALWLVLPESPTGTHFFGTLTLSVYKTLRRTRNLVLDVYTGTDKDFTHVELKGYTGKKLVGRICDLDSGATKLTYVVPA